VVASLDPFDGDIPDRPACVQYVTNVQKGSNVLLVTVVNNEPFPVWARLTGKHATIISATDLLHESNELPIANGTVDLALFPGHNADRNMFILELTFDGPVVQFMQG